MKLLFILFSAFFVAVLFDVGLAWAGAPGSRVRPSKAVSAAYPQAMEECKARYRGLDFHHGGARSRVGSFDAPILRRPSRKRPACIRSKPT
jgi:hypothetical protein